MSRLQHTLCVVRRLQQAPLRLRSTVAVTDAVQAATPSAASAEWDSARPYSEIPGPRPLPLIGNAWRFFPVIGEYNNLEFDQLYERLYNQYGPICKLSGMPGRPDMLIVFDADYVQTVFRNEGTWPVRRGADSMEHFFRDVRKNIVISLIASHGKEWQEFRSAVNQVMMQPRNTVQYVEPIDRVSQEFVDRMREIRDESGMLPVTFYDELSKWAMESITYVALDTRIGILGNKNPNSEASVMMDSVQGVFDSVYELDIKPSAWKFISTPTYRKFIRNMNTFTDVAAKYVEKAMDRLKSMSRDELEQRTPSVLENLLLNTNDPNKAVSMAMDMLLAGVDTTGAVTATVLYQLATNPDKQRVLQEELDRVIPDRNKTITKEQMEQLKYLRACVKEAMRIMPILASNFRDTGKDTSIGGYKVPKGTITSMGTYQMHLNEKYFPRAKEFLPERFLAEGIDLKSSHPFAYVPFGFGPRMCAGKRFAVLEMENVVAKIFRNFTLEWNHPPAVTKFFMLLKFVTPLQFTIKDRA